MESLKSRLKSFSKGKASKGASKSSALTWPHPDSFAANPTSLAEAGFYFSPSVDDPDNVVCFMCEKELGGWEKDDDPFAIHVEKRPKCPWAAARCSLEHDCELDGNFSFKEAARLPSNKALEKARLDTFGGKLKWWPHDSVKSHGATSKKMAKAGFVYTPQESGIHDDTATCFYCDLSLSGWDPEDDPATEHRKREERTGKSCVFFTATVSKPSTSKAINSVKKPKVLSQKVTKVDLPSSADNTDDAEAIAVDSMSVASTKQRGRKTTSLKSKSKAEESKEVLEVTKPLKSSHRKKSVKQVSHTGDEDVEAKEDLTQTSRPVTGKPSDKRNGKKSTVSDAEKGRDEDDSRRGRSQHAVGPPKPPSDVDGKIVKGYEDHVVPLDDPATTKQRTVNPDSRPGSSRSRSRSRPPEAPKGRAKSHTRTRSKTKVTTDDEEEESPINSGTSKPKKPTKAKKAPQSTAVEKPAASRSTTRASTPVGDLVDHEIPDVFVDEPAMDVDSSSREIPAVKAVKLSNAAKPINRTKSTTAKDVQRKEPMEDRSNTSHLNGHTVVDGSFQHLRDNLDQINTVTAVQDVRLHLLSASAEGSPKVEVNSGKSKTGLPPPLTTSPPTVENVQDRNESMDVDRTEALPSPPVAKDGLVVLRALGDTDKLPNLTGEDIVTQLPEFPDRDEPPSPSLEPPAPFLPPLAILPMEVVTALSEEERRMTVEEYIRFEMSRRYDELKKDGLRSIEAFRQHVAEVRAKIEAL